MSYEVLDYINKEGDSIIAIELTSGRYSGVIYSYGKVEFPDELEPILSFEYILHEGNIEEVDNFKKTIGDILVEIIEESVKNRTTVFSGGI